MGLKLVPLDEHGTPVEAWTPIYDDPEYWNHDKLSREEPKFKNVATCFGKTHLKDSQGNDLYLNCLDIDSEGAYKILFDLENHGRQYSFIAEAIKNTFVNKTRKPNGYQIFWFSHKLDQPITSKDCKPGLEFEIKTGKAGLCTLPGSTHRDDHNFRYKNYGQETIIISDDMYARIVEVLEHCLQPKRVRDRIRKESRNNGDKVELSDADVQVIAECIRPYYKKGRRHPIIFGLSGLLHKSGISKDSAVALVETISKGDNEHDVRTAVKTVEEVFGSDANIVAGTRYLSDALVAAVGNSAIARDILDKIFRLIGKEDSIQWLTRAIMNEHTFRTTTDNEDIYCYDDEKCVYVSGQEWRIKSLSQLMYPELTTHQLHEVINQIRRRSYVDRSCFESNPNILNLRDGLLDVHSKQIKPHSPDHLSTVQLPIEYKPRTVCPGILRFFREVLRPEDIHVVLQMIGYCLYPNCEYHKGFMFFGEGSNGKGVLIKIIEALLGENNCSHRSLQDLDKNRFATADLFGKLANTYSDLKSLKLSETGNFKMIVSGDSITAERKFSQPFAFRNYAKLIFSANEIPESDDKTDAFYRRWRIFHFDKKFQNGKEDPTLTKRLTTPAELSGLLNLALIGLRQLIDAGGFHDKKVEETRTDYEENTNDVNAFLYQECIVDITKSEYSTLATDAYAAYVNFCVARGARSVDMNVFGKKLAARGIYNVRHRDSGPREAYYDGLRLLKDLRGSNQALV